MSATEPPRPLTLRVAASALRELVSSAWFRGTLGVAREGVSVLVVEIDDAGALAAVGDRLRALPCVLVGWAPAGDVPPVSDLDLLLTTSPLPPRPWVTVPSIEQAVEDIETMVARAPLAATTVVRLLRLQEPLPVSDALAAESFAYATLQGGSEFQAWLARRPAGPGARPVDTPVIVEHHDDGLTELILNRPSVRNAYSTAMRDALVAALEDFATRPSGRLLLRGNGPAFSAGGDLGEFGATRDAALAHAIRMESSPALLLAESATRVSARVHGACVGAGIELPAYAGHVTADTDAYFLLPEVGMGLLPGAGGTVSISRRCGRQRTAFLALTGRPIDAETALAWGLVDQLVAAARP